MSAAVGSAKQPNVLSEELEALYDPYWGFALNNLCADIPWPEWTDAELNAEAWDEGKGTRANTVAGAKLPSTANISSFDDPQPPSLPPSMSEHVKVWKRAQDVFPGETLTVYDPANVDFELQLLSTISSECNFLRVFIEQLTILQFYAVKYGFQVELESPNFVPNTQGDTWRPWHHVYALCKAGKGQVHKPQYCPYGKYVLRLFYMGTWRRFIVDDKIPCDVNDSCMLPVTQSPGELWPILLAKGIFKILSLTPTTDFELTDFPLVSTFTGWTHGHFATENKSSDQVWRRLSVLSPHYEQPEEAKSTAVLTKNPNPKKESSRKDSRKSPDREDAQGARFCVLLANLMGFSFEENLSVDCTVAITMTRDCPLLKANKREGTKPWKRIRWIYWAKEKGLWIDENQLPPYRRLQIVTFVPELADLLLPDPKLEAALYDIPMEEESGTEEELSVGEGKVFEPEQWCDYFRFLDYVVGVNVFFKPSYFISNFKVSCLREKVVESPRVAKGTSKPPPAQNILIFPTNLKQTFNEPIFLLCEALTGIFLSISLWVCPQNQRTCFGYLEPNQPKLLKVGHASLVVELFDWRFITEGEIIGLIKTVGYSSVVLNLKPGRHILKLWLYSDSSYIIDINSNVNFLLSKSPKIRFLMNTESQQILQYIHNVSNSFIALTQKFGKPDLPAALRDFYETIKPKNDSVRDYYRKLDDFIENFLTCILLILRDLIPQAEEVMIMMWALQALFLNPNIRCDLDLGGPVPSFYGGNSAKKAPRRPTLAPVERSPVDIINDVPEEDRNKVVTIQKIFRGFRVRLLWKCQAPGRKEFKPYTDRLKKICDTVFAPPKRELEVGKLLRRVVMNKPDLLTTFKFHKDFSNVLQVEEFTGKIPNVEPFAWIPIARFVIACHCEGTVPCAFYLSCNLEQTVIQGFDNDLGVEIFRVANTVSPHYYHSNVRGYTILVFGWNEANLKTVNWRLEMVKMKHFQSVHLCNLLVSSTCQPYTIPTIDTLEIRNFYIPNSRSRIFRCLIKIQKRTLLTLRISLSYSCVRFVIVLWLEDKNYECAPESNPERIIAEVMSTNGAVIMPSLLLEYVESVCTGESYPDGDYTVYILEGYVLDNSWPLTKQEWGLVEPIRVNGESWKDSSTSMLFKRGGSESRKKLNRSRRSMSEQKIENPFWLLQVLNDSAGPESSDAAIIEEDKSYAEAVKAMKLLWEEKDPGRRKRGREIRMNFLYMMYLEQRRGQFVCGEDCGEDNRSERSGDATEDPQAIVDRLSSFTYLVNDVSPTRYICSPRILPVMPLKELLCKYTAVEDTPASNSQESESKETPSFDYTEVSYGIVDDLVEDMEDERQDFLRQCLHYRGVLASWLAEEQKLSSLLMDQAYEARLNAVERMLR